MELGLLFERHMKTKILLAVFLSCIYTVAWAGSFSYESLTADSLCMQSSYDKAKARHEDRVEEFLECFPKTFREFSAVFGYGGGAFQNKSIISDTALVYGYLDLFFDLNKEKENYTALFTIALNGRWEVDAVNYYRHKLKSFINNDPKIAAKSLSSFSHEHLQSFWLYYFDGPSLPKEIPLEVQRLKVESQQVYIVASDIFDYYRKVYVSDTSS